jgi:serine/threonine-protein kinase RIO1
MVKKRYTIEEVPFYRESKMVHLTLSKYASITAEETENITILIPDSVSIDHNRSSH